IRDRTVTGVQTCALPIFLGQAQLALWRAETMEQSLGIVRERQSHSFVASIFFVFAALAVCLAALGIHGVIAHSVAERRRELGVRSEERRVGKEGRRVWWR